MEYKVIITPSCSYVSIVWERKSFISKKHSAPIDRLLSDEEKEILKCKVLEEMRECGFKITTE